MSKEAMSLALAALENGRRVRNAEGGTKYQPDLEYKAITALREALSQHPAPVAPDLVSVPDDMIKWPGGDCPVPGDTEVVVKFRGGGTSGGDAGGYDWSHCGGKTLATADIVAYRVATATPQAPKEKGAGEPIMIDNNMPAFPVTSDNYANGEGGGMTLRDYFAAKAMQTLMAVEGGTLTKDAKAAYEAADAMMHMRTQAQENQS